MSSPKVDAAPVLSSSDPLSTAGYFRLSWSGQAAVDASAEYELQQAVNERFTDAKTIYRGPDEATVISGLPDQRYFYRVRHLNSDEWSPVVEVEVKHHPLSRAFGFFALGAVMFVATVIALLKGARGRV